MNQVMLVGRLGADPELKQAGGTSVCNLRMATSESKKVNGVWEKYAEWHRVTVFGKVAENCSKYLSKGRELSVVGRLQTSQWEDNNGNKRYTTEVIAHSVEFIGGQGQGQSQNRNQNQNQQQPFGDGNQSQQGQNQQGQQNQNQQGFPYSDAEIPF